MNVLLSTDLALCEFECNTTLGSVIVVRRYVKFLTVSSLVRYNATLWYDISAGNQYKPAVLQQ